MASPVLTKGEQNFIRFVKICLDVFKLPLADILASEIQPADLYKKIQQHSCSLLNGKHRLDSKQENICFRLPPAIPDYNEFDVTLLYKLIRNLCPSLEPTKGWGKDPVDTDTQIGDDIERLRLFRNNNFHDVSSEISDKEFDIICKKLKFVFQRIQIHMASKGYKANYEENMTNIKQLNLGDEHIDKYKIAFLERTIDQLQADGMEKPKISIKGPTSVLCGNNAKFSAEINPENLKGWSITWQKIVQQTYIRINSSTEKYSGSTDKILVIQSVCKGDSGGYQTILSRDSEAKNISVSSNVIVLRAIGGPPIFEVWDVTTGMDGIKIHYGFKKRPPYVNEIKWIKDEVPILNRNKKFEGGGLNDSYFTITSPTIEDRGNYSCVVKNAVGSVQKDVKFDVPYVEISTEQEVYFGSKTSFTSRIVSCPSLDRVEWQQSNDGKTFKSIIISKPKYYGSSCDPKSPLLIIPKVKFEDKLYYRLLVWNKIGEQYSNTVFLDVKGSLPNITINHKTCVSNRSITLIGNVFLYGKFPAVKNVFWTKNGEELDTKGSGGRYSEVTVDNPSLAIFEVNEYDAGSYQLIATNALGSTTSDFLILDVPDVSLAKPEKKNSGFWFTVTIQSIPAPDFAQWSMKEKSSDTFIPIDENAEEFKGTSNTLPHPVLVVNPNTDLENYCFQIEVRNFIGSCKKITPGEGSSEDSFTNGNQGGLSKIYLDGGAGLKFAKLFDDIAELFPEKKTRRLKDFIQNSQNGKDITLFAQTVTARDCLEILRDHKLFTPWDVIFMQYLLKNTECKELFEKCVAYAEAHWALCFYEKLPENGFKNVQFHVRANLSCYTPVEIRKIKETVADIVGCNSTEVFVNGYSHSSSFLAVLSIEKKHVKKLLTMNQQEKGKLSRLKIDFFIVDFIKVYLQSPQEIRGADDTGDYPIMLRKLCDKPTTLGSALFEKHSKELVPDTSDIVNAIQTASISVSVKEVKHISCLMPNRLWVSDMKKVQEIDKNGRILKELDIYFTLFGSHTVTQSGDLLFLKDNDVLMLTSNGEVRNLSIHASVHFCIHSSRMNGDILIGDINTVTRYNNLGIKLNEINLNDEGQSLYVETIFITENTNGDIIVSDNGKKAVVATDKSGRFFFNYKGHHSQTTFHPGGICTDDFGHILVCNVSGDPSVHLLHQKGQFLAYLLTKHQHGSDCPQAVCVDSQHNLYVGYSNSNRINVYSYPTKEKLGDLYTKEIEANTNLKLTAIKRKSYNDLNVTPTPHFDEKTNWSLSLNEKHLFKGHSVSAIAPTKKISMVDSQNVEKRATKTDSVEEKGSDLDVTFMRKQEVRPITPRKSFYKAETYFAKKINSGNLSPNGEEKKPTQALQLSLELALNERDLMLRENAKAVEERDQAIRQLELLKSERDSALASLENITGKPSKNTNTKSAELSPPAHRKSQRLLDKFREMEPETDQEDGFVKTPKQVKGLDNVTWETHNVTLRRVPGFGFGIAVSGGRDNPHFANGDPSIAISDVLTAGPAEGKLLINDRVMSVNGIPLENVDHKQAIAVLKDSGNKVNLVIRRRVLVPTYTDTENTPLKITLSRKNRREDFGVVLGCKYFIKEITGNSIAAQDGGLKEGDIVLKINSTAIENLSLVDAKKLIEKTKDKLQLFIAKTRYEDRGPANKAQDDEYSLGYGTLQGTLQNKRSDIDNVNIYRPSLSSPEEEIYKGHHNYQEIPPGSYPNSEHARYDGRYIYDHEAPPRPPLPDETDAPPRPPSPGKELLRPDDFYSPRSPRSPHPPHSPPGDGYLSDHGRMDPHGQRRHDERYVGKRKDIVLDPRFVYFEKEPEFGLGLRLAGGNATGIFIASVQPGSGAEAVGLTEGDQILKANDVEIPGMTREDAVTYLTSLEGRVSMVVQYKREEYDRIISSHEAGDSFFIRTHFEYQAKDMGELSFTIGDIFHIKDTLFRGVVGSWLAMRIGRNNQETQKGFIPNRNSAEQIFLSTTQTEAEKENTPTKSRSLLFKRKAARRSKSLGKDHWEDVIFSENGANLTTKFPAYERVNLRDTGFVRPVVIFGALADVAREKLLQDFPDKFESPQTDASSQGGNDQRKSGIIRLGAIKEIINKRKHCLLDVTPHNVDKLNYAQYYPIVVFLKAENKNIVKDCRAKFAKGSTKNHKKLFEQSQKLEKLYPHLFTATISHNNTEVWYSRLQEMIHLQQEQQIWMSEHKPEDNVNDDFLFPMGSRASYSPAQDTEPGNTPKTHPDDFDASPKHKKRLVRSSSDPSINTTDRVPGIPPYPAPPSYHRSPGSPNRKLMDDRRYVDFDRQSEDRYYPSYYASESLPHGQFPHTRSIEPYATITHHERLRSKIPEDGQWYNPAYDDRGPQKFNPDYHRSEPDLGRHVNHNRPSTASLPPPQPHQTHDPGQGQPPHPPHHLQPFQENASSYSSDSYSRYTSNPVNRHDDSKLREKFGSLAVAAKGERSIGHDPYRFTRSTANPVNTANIDKSKLSDLSARYRKDEHPPTRKQSLPSPVISPSVNQPPASSAPSHHAPLQQDGAPPRVKKEPPPVPVKTYHLRDRGIEPDDLKIRNYENSNRAYNYADPSSYSGPDQKHHYNEQNENPYDYVAPRQNSAPRSRTSPNQNAVYARPYASPDRHSREGSYDRGRSFMNQIYMDTEQLQKLRARQENHPPTSNHGNREATGARDSGYPGPERPRDHSRAVNHEASDRERSSHEDSSDHGSAFEAYRKPAMSTFGKVPAGKGFEPSKHISATLSSDTNPPTAPTVNSSSPPEESAQRSEDTDQGASDNAVKGESSNIEQVNASNTFLVGSDNGQLIEGNHTVVATARGVFDHQGGVLESPETGVSIVIPKGAIPEGVSQEIYFKVCKDNNILPPLDKDKGETLLSPLVMCGPHGLKFLLPVELRLPHCASVNPDSWSFALKSSDSPTGHPTQWQNMTLAGMDGVAQGRVGKNSVSVLVDHF